MTETMWRAEVRSSEDPDGEIVWNKRLETADAVIPKEAAAAMQINEAAAGIRAGGQRRHPGIPEHPGAGPAQGAGAAAGTGCTPV